MQMPVTNSLPEHLAYSPGTRLRRVGALFIDMLLLSIVGYALLFLTPGISGAFGRWSFLSGYLIAGLYFSVCDSRWLNGQTLGKKLLKLQVVDRNGKCVGFFVSSGRFLIALTPWFLNGRVLPPEWFNHTVVVSILSLLVFGLGVSNLFLFVATATKQTLQDLVFKTAVVATPLTTITDKPVAKWQYVVAVCLLVLSLLIPIATSRLVPTADQIQSLTAVQREVDRIEGVSYATITDMTNYLDESVVTHINIVLIKASRTAEDERLAKKACEIVKIMYPYANERDFIRVHFSYGSDIGIASLWRKVQSLSVKRGQPCG